MSEITREIVNAFRFEVQCNVELASSYESLRAENQKLQIRISDLENQVINLTADQKTTDIRWDEKTKTIRQAHNPAGYFPEI